MFHKIIKRGSRRHHSKSYDNEPTVWKSNQLSTSGVTVNHASHTMVSSMVVNSLQQPGPERTPATGTSDSVIVQTPLFKDAPSSDHQALFLRKLQICCNVFDFSDTFMSVREKEIKRHTLLELVEFIQANAGKISEKAHEELIRMISVNIFRCLPPSAHENSVIDNFDPEEEDSFQEPSWIHLQIVYELLFRYIASPEVDTKIGKRYINHLFVSKLIDLFDSEDHREREYLKTILHRIYGKFMVHRPFIRKTISNIFYRFVFEVERYSGISELLEILGSIINGFALPMKEEHKLFLARALIPLHKPKSLAVYHHHLSYCVTQFVDKDSSLADVVIRGLLKFWPVVNCQKEVLFLTELEEVLEVTQSAEFQRCMVPLFKQIGRCLNSSHFQVAERTLFLWNNDHIVSLIAQNRSVIFPILFASLEKNMKGHWNQVVHGLTTNVWKMFQEMDSDLFEECQRQQEEKEPQAKASEEQRQEAWRRLEEAVAAKDVMH